MNRVHLDADVPAALRARAAMSRRGGGRGSVRRGGGGGGTPEFNPASISGLVIDLDARDVAAGAFTSIASRVNGYVFNGNATRDTAVNGRPTVSLNGSQILSSSATLSQISGVSAVTMILGAIDTNTGTAIVCDYGPNPGVSAVAFELYVTATIFANYLRGDVGTSSYSIAETLATARVLSTVLDKSLASGEASLIRRDGVVVTPTVITSNNNGNTFGNLNLHIGARAGPSLGWAGGFTKFLLFNRALTAGELQQCERLIGSLSSISVA